MRFMRFALVLAVALAVLPFAPAGAADLAAERVGPAKGGKKLFGRCSYFDNVWLFGDPRDCPGDETVPACNAPRVMKAAQRFANRAKDVYRVPDVKTFTFVREVPDPVYNPSPLVRRYCEAAVTLTDGHHTTAYYFVEEDSGFVGLSWSVYVCLQNYDRWRVYDGRCRVARPAPRH